MNFIARDGVIFMTSYRKEQKVVNIRRNPKVAACSCPSDQMRHGVTS
jgi:ribosomal protein L24E